LTDRHKISHVTRIDPRNPKGRYKFEFAKKQDRGHNEKPKNRNISATVGPIGTKFRTLTHIGPLLNPNSG